jgi:hypothetical protein
MRQLPTMPARVKPLTPQQTDFRWQPLIRLRHEATPTHRYRVLRHTRHHFTAIGLTPTAHLLSRPSQELA